MILQNLGWTALLLGVLVFVHELGHFLVAKALGVKVLRFSIGFGPRLIGFTRGETEYQLAALPLGGYVKMAGEVPGEDVRPEEQARGFLAQPPWRRALIVAAGPAFNLAFPVLVFLVVFLSYPQLSTKVLTLEPGMPAAVAGIRLGDVVTRVDGERVRTFDDLRRALERRYGREIRVTVQRDGRELTLPVTPARAQEPGLTKPVARGRIGISPQARPPLVGVPAGSPAAAAGLRTFDRILAVNGNPVSDMLSLAQRLDGAQGPLALDVMRRLPAQLPGVDAAIPERLRLQMPKQPGSGLHALGVELADLYVGRVAPGSPVEKAGLAPGDRLVAFGSTRLVSLEPLRQGLEQAGDKPFALTWSHDGAERTAELRQVQNSGKDELGQDVHGLDLGLRAVFPTDAERPAFDRVQLGLGPAFVASLHKVGDIVEQVATSLALLVVGKVPFKSLGGPIMLYDIASRSAQAGLDTFLGIMALISVNLGLINLLPVPILDGFQLLAAAWEGIRRRPIPVRAREIANMVGLAMLLVLMFFVFKNDLTR